MNVLQFIIGILLIIPGAFMIADGILTLFGTGAIFFGDVNYKFEMVVGLAVIIVGASRVSYKNNKL